MIMNEKVLFIIEALLDVQTGTTFHQWLYHLIINPHLSVALIHKDNSEKAFQILCSLTPACRSHHCKLSSCTSGAFGTHLAAARQGGLPVFYTWIQ